MTENLAVTLTQKISAFKTLILIVYAIFNSKAMNVFGESKK